MKKYLFLFLSLFLFFPSCGTDESSSSEGQGDGQEVADRSSDRSDRPKKRKDRRAENTETQESDPTTTDIAEDNSQEEEGTQTAESEESTEESDTLTEESIEILITAENPSPPSQPAPETPEPTTPSPEPTAPTVSVVENQNQDIAIDVSIVINEPSAEELKHNYLGYCSKKEERQIYFLNHNPDTEDDAGTETARQRICELNRVIEGLTVEETLNKDNLLSLSIIIDEEVIDGHIDIDKPTNYAHWTKNFCLTKLRELMDTKTNEGFSCEIHTAAEE